MIQQILTYIIIAAAVGYTLRGLYRILASAYKKGGSACSGCLSCEIKRELSAKTSGKH